MNRMLFGIPFGFAVFDAIFQWQAGQKTDGVGYHVVLGLCLFIGVLFLHELSHAVVALVLGGRVFGIHMGSGTPLFQGWIGGFYFGISLQPLSGVAFCGFASPHRIKLRYGLMIAAGPMLHLFFLIAISLYVLSDFGPDHLGSPGIMLVVINAVMLVTNLLPKGRNQTIAGTIGTDGNQLWRLVTGQLDSAKLTEGYLLTAASFALQKNPDLIELAEIEEGLANDPQNEALNQIRCVMLLRRERFKDCLEILQKIIEDTDEVEDESEQEAVQRLIKRAMTYNTFAWVLLMDSQDPLNLRTARQYADKAFEMLPWVAPIRGTRAAIQIEQDDDVETAIETALEVARFYKKGKTRISQEYCATEYATAALGFHRVGKKEDAANFLEQARRLAPNDLQVKRAVAALL